MNRAGGPSFPARRLGRLLPLILPLALGGCAHNVRPSYAEQGLVNEAFRAGDMAKVKAFMATWGGPDRVRDIQAAVQKGDADTVRDMLKENPGLANSEFILDDYSGGTPMHTAVSRNHASVVKALIEGGADLEARNRSGVAPLHVAAANGYVDIIRLLISSGAGANPVDPQGRTPLHFAVQSQQQGSVRVLLKKGARVNARDGNGNTPLMVAVAKSDAATAKILIEEGSSPGTADETGSTPLHLAARAGQKDIAMMLLDRGVDVNAAEKLLGWTPLFEAVNNNKPGTALFLLSRGAKPNARDKRGRTALADATDLGYDEIADLLRTHGAKK